MKTGVLLVATALAALSGCGSVRGHDGANMLPRPGALSLVSSFGPARPLAGSPQVAAVTADEEAFALDLLARLGPDAPNLVLSPSSIATLLAMVEPGAAGATQVGIAHALHSSGLTATDQALGWHALDATLAQQTSQDKITLDTANSAWVQVGLPVLSSYIRLLTTDFGAAVQEQDMQKDPVAAAQAIDRWVASRTGGQITGLLSPAQLQNVVAVLVDAVYMAAPWATAFDVSRTATAPFHVSSTSTVSVPMMSSPQKFEAPVLASSALDAAELPYKGGHLSALVLMPPLGRLGAFESELTPARLAQTVADLRAQPVSVQLPRFALRSNLRLNQVLSAMGMGQAFSLAADFSDLSPKGLRLSFIVQDAQVKVTEAGTEASAATGGGLTPTAVAAPPGITIVFNHPFLFVVRDDSTGTVIFAAQVSNPAMS